MPSFTSGAYANHPIQIPPEFPKILKQYTKAAIRTQPKDLLLWSVSYFRSLANGEAPPVKERLEYPVPPSESGLTPGLLRVLNKQMADPTSTASLTVSKATLKSKWRGICLSIHHLEEILHSAPDGLDNAEEVAWAPFVLAAAASIAPHPTAESWMEVACEALAEQPEGVASELPEERFLEMFRLAAKKCEASEDQTAAVEKYLRSAAERQSGRLMPQNLKSSECPALT